MDLAAVFPPGVGHLLFCQLCQSIRTMEDHTQDLGAVPLGPWPSN